MPLPSPRPALVRRAFTVVAVLEAFTWVGLLVGMYLKHVAGTTEAGVWLFGRLHGAAFVAYVLTTLVTARVLRWGPVVTLVALAASVPRWRPWCSRCGHAGGGSSAARRPTTPLGSRVGVRASPPRSRETSPRRSRGGVLGSAPRRLRNQPPLG
ncbi:DUF3817 domain-containing protein [Cellulomonas sp. ATA003]|uniref:DUF3817 domain-containing protein n=1 Tax=Cellulomonas sp. ATA003 TaxID=3073064 RepID=UPI002872E321|nr:DUF3817 domain-containing protein [Cellulomonas sp. ATA003]WNB85715.1 DUF3817 domain-containing protein [Cellulomonas sp. ATA003]